MTDSEVSTIDDVQAVAPPKPAKAKAKQADDRKMLTIHATDGDGGDENVFVSVNGYAYYIKRGTPVPVPDEVIEVLKNATVTKYRQGQNGATEPHEVPRHTFTVS